MCREKEIELELLAPLAESIISNWDTSKFKLESLLAQGVQGQQTAIYEY